MKNKPSLLLLAVTIGAMGSSAAFAGARDSDASHSAAKHIEELVVYGRKKKFLGETGIMICQDLEHISFFTYEMRLAISDVAVDPGGHVVHGLFQPWCWSHGKTGYGYL